VNPGWYADPHGGPDLRWWDGSSWTEHTTPPVDAAPIDTAPQPAASGAPAGGDPWGPPASAPAAPPPSGDPWGHPPQPAPGSQQWAPPSGSTPVPPGSGPGSGFTPPPAAPGANRTPLFVALGVVVALALVVGGVVLLSGGDDSADPEPTTTTTADDPTTTDDDTTTTTDDTTTTAPQSELISTGGLSYTRLPDPWQDWVANGQAGIPELQGTAGQFVVVQENAPSGGQWIGNLLIGELISTIPYGGPGDLPVATQAITDQLVAGYYVEGAVATPIQSVAVTIDGHPAHFIHTELSFAQAGLETTNEKVVVVVVDTGRPRPGVFWASIPYNRADLNDGMDQVYRSLVVND